MKKSKNYKTKLGFFITIGLLLFVLVIYYLGSRQNIFGSKSNLIAMFEDVNGLRKGNNVRYSGINVGTVDNIQIINDSVVKVEMLIENDIFKFIRKDSRALVATDGIIGNKIVIITSGTATAQTVEPGDILKTKDPVELTDIMEKFSKSGENIIEISANLNKVLKSLNSKEGTLGRLINDTTIAYKLRLASDNAVGITRNVNAISNDLRMMVTKVEEGHGNLARLIYDTTMMHNLNTAALQASEISKNIGEFSEKLNSNEGLLHKLITDSAMAKDVDQAVHNVNQLSASLTENFSDVDLKNNFVTRLFFDLNKEEK